VYSLHRTLPTTKLGGRLGGLQGINCLKFGLTLALTVFLIYPPNTPTVTPPVSFRMLLGLSPYSTCARTASLDWSTVYIGTHILFRELCCVETRGAPTTYHHLPPPPPPPPPPSLLLHHEKHRVMTNVTSVFNTFLSTHPATAVIPLDRRPPPPKDEFLKEAFRIVRTSPTLT